MSSSDLTVHDTGHFRVLGVCWIVYGLICLASAVWLVSFTNTATVMFGSLLNRVPNPFALMSDFHLVYTLLIILSVICGVVGLLAGFALVAGLRMGRPLGLVAGFLSLSNIPLGTTLGIYSLIVLLPFSAFHASDPTNETHTAGLRHQPATM